jgi:outer membrane protein assembly factor BamA
MRLAHTFLLIALLVPMSAAAQETRAEALERERAEKAKTLAPYKPDKLEKFVRSAEEGKIRRMLTPHNGFFVEYGYSHKVTGSGVGFGGGWRHDLFDRHARVELEAGMTFKNYQLLRADFSLPRLFEERVEVGVEAYYVNQPQDDFYGLGVDSLETNRTNFLYRGTDLQARAIYKPREWANVGVRIGRLSPSIRSGKDSNYPSIEQVFSDATAPGLLRQPDFSYTEGFVDIDFRDEPGNARAGGRYAFSNRLWRDDVQEGPFDFNSWDFLAQHYFPIFDKKRVFAAQLLLASTNADPGDDVPFYFQPTIGGSKSVRSIDDFRLRDRNALQFNFEYRWEAFGAMDMALFTDWGKVGRRFEDLDFSDMKRAYGIGFRFKTASAVFFRIDLAAGGGDGFKYHFKFSNVF